MKALKYILFLLVILFIGFAIYIAVQPNDFVFKRSKIMKAPTPVVYNVVNDFKEWPRFSPWIEQDTDAVLTYNDKTSGVDAGYSWDGEILGIGSMKTTDVLNNTSIVQQIEFIEPFESNSNINWTFEPAEEGTKVTWSMNGKQDFMTKLYTVFMGSIEEATGPDFERGLYKLDSIVQADMKKYSITIEGITQHGGGFYLYNTASSRIEDLEQKKQEMMPIVGGYALSNNITMAGKPFVLYHKWDTDNNTVMFSCCVPTTSKIETSDPNILTGQLEPFKAVKTVLKGDYINSKEAWNKAMAYIKDNDLKEPLAGPVLESYVTDSKSTPNPANWITEIYLAVE
ncbi:transcription activator effector-binding protein [Psychroserpens burtonensis]|uniref:Transcription activator effector-binding protein n=1 Tax=Psychroserpens burtonensis TaxID=49278 RepID=A0A5C7BAG0_9FLAO|nr:SRPBCC family protein [Psychroserpens burtonensis]TXE18541.1 transcription activator effector-binding protein [Psychroserpens burtonensis]